MEFNLIYITVLLISLIASVFVVITNVNDSKKSITKLDFRVLSIQLIILLAWIIILARALKANTVEEAVINTAVFVFSLVIGVLVIQSVIKENKASSVINKLVHKLSLYNRRLRNLDRQKTEFVSTASHQLRSPSSAILGYSSMLLEEDYGKLTKKQKDIVKIIFESSSNLNNIINELLDTTRIEQNRMKYSSSEFDMVDVLENLSGVYKNLAERRGISFIEDYNSDYSLLIKGDREKIKQAITNLFDNAIKYTKEGSITVTAKKIEKKVHVCIKDTGIGIKQDEINGIFNKFVRASNAESMSVSGSGLGLFIAREIVLSNGGQIWVESEGQGKGCKFCVEFKSV